MANSKSVLDPDNFGPMLLDVEAINESEVRIVLNERIDPSTVTDADVETTPTTELLQIIHEFPNQLIVHFEGLHI